MNNLNSILLEGNLVRDPDLKSTPSGTPVCTFAVASNRWYKQNEQLEKEVSFFDVEAWSKLAQTCGDTLKKGRGRPRRGKAQAGPVERRGRQIRTTRSRSWRNTWSSNRR